VSKQKRGTIITNKNQVLARWKEYFEEHLIKDFESVQPTLPVDLRDDGVDIDLPSREEIEGALKYLKNNKAASADSIAAGTILVDALHEVIQQAWTSETLPRSWTKSPRGYCVQCTRRAINSIVKTIEGMNQHYQTNSLHCAKS
jgi:hypothetical protein